MRTLLFDSLAAYTAVVSLLFVGLFLTQPWRTRAFGWSLMIMAACIAAMSLMIALTRVFGAEYPGRFPVLLFGYFGVAIAMTTRLVVLCRHVCGNRRKAKAERRRENAL